MTTPQAPWLRPLGVGERIDAGIKLYRRNFKVVAAAVAVVGVPIALMYGAVQWWLTTTITNTQPAIVHNFDGSTSVHWSSLDALYGKLAITYFVAFVLTVAAKAIVYRAYTDSYLGAEITARGVLSGGLSRFGSVLWITVLIEGTIAASTVLVAVMVIALSPLGPAAILPAVVAAMMLVAFWFWWSIANRFAVASMMLEGLRGRQALRRSMALVRGSWWSVFGTLVLVEIIVLLLGAAFNIAFRLLANLIVPTTNLGPHAFVFAVFGEIGSLLVLLPFTASVVTVMCIDMRVRKEGLDLELAASGSDAPTDDALAGAASGSAPQPSPWPAAPATEPPSPPWPPAQSQ